MIAALLTGTIGYAAQALLHACLVAAIVFFGFASIGVWRFGYEREEYADLHTAIATQISIMFSPETPDGWDDDLDFMLFIFAYIFFMFLLVLNLVLAS